DSVVTGTVALPEARGGGLYMDAGTLTSNGGAFINNSATGPNSTNGRGGAVFGEEGPLTYNGYAVLFQTNTAKYAGGVIATNAGSDTAFVHIERSLMVGNSAANGGVAYIDPSALQSGLVVEISDSTLTDNIASSTGGVFFAGS